MIGYGHLEQRAQPLSDRPQTGRFNDLALGPAKVAHQHDGCAVVEQVLDRGQRGADARVVLDLAILDGDVEIDAHDNAFALRIEIPDGLLLHVWFLRAAGEALDVWSGVRSGGAGGLHQALPAGQALGDERRQIRDAAAVAPFVVIPGDDLDEVAQHHRRLAIDDR